MALVPSQLPSTAPAPARRLYLGPLVLLLCIPPVLYGMHLANRAALSRITATLQRVTGVEVSLGSLEATPAPGFALHDLRVANLVQVPRIDVRLGFDGFQPRVRHVSIVRPHIDLDLDRWRLPSAARASKRSHKGGGVRDRLGGATVSIHEGDVSLAFQVGGRKARLHARDVFLTPFGRRHRLVAGETRIEMAGREIATLASAALELDRRWRLRRGAALGGRLVFPGTQGVTLDLLGARLERKGPKLLRLRVEAEPRQRDGGRLLLAGDFALVRRPGSRAQRPTLLQGTAELRDLSLSAAAPLLGHRGIEASLLRISGVVSARREQQLLRTDVDVTLQGLRINDARLAPQPLDAPLVQLAGRAFFNAKRNAWALPRLRVTMGQLTGSLSGELASVGSERRLTLDLHVPSTSCQAALASMPVGFVPRLEGMALQGNLGMTAHLEFQPSKIEEGDVNVRLTPLTCRVLVDPPHANIKALLARKRKIGPSAPLPAALRRGPLVALAHISPLLRAAFVSAEDQRFFHHKGFDVKQLERAFLRNLAERRFGRGASTISQQLVKNLYLSHRRNISRKLQEAVLTWRLEQVLDKRRILELYLNIVEMGPGVHGVEQASREYFGRPARRVDPLQAAHLAALTPSPRPLAQRFRRVKPGEAWRARLRRVLRLMRLSGAISRATEATWAKRRLDLRLLPTAPASPRRRTIAAANNHR